jgi:hypothetical protein
MPAIPADSKFRLHPPCRRPIWRKTFASTRSDQSKDKREDCCHRAPEPPRRRCSNQRPPTRGSGPQSMQPRPLARKRGLDCQKAKCSDHRAIWTQSRDLSALASNGGRSSTSLNASGRRSLAPIKKDQWQVSRRSLTLSTLSRPAKLRDGSLDLSYICFDGHCGAVRRKPTKIRI